MFILVREHDSMNTGPYIAGGQGGAVAPARKTKCFFSNIVFDFVGLLLVAILVKNRLID